MNHDGTDLSARLARAQLAMAEHGMDAMLVTPGADLRYLIGYHALALERLTCLIVPRTGQATLIVPSLERPAAEGSAARDMDLRMLDYADGQDPFLLVSAALAGLEQGTIALSNQMWAEKVLKLRSILPDAQYRLAGDILAMLRTYKTLAELIALRSAARSIDAVHSRMGEWLRAGRTEAEVSVDIALAIREVGHAAVDFTIVGSGPNGASPHHEVSDRQILPGDIVVVDIGGMMPDGYRSDCTRTYVVGKSAPGMFVENYEHLRAAHSTAIAAVRPGVTAEAVDAAARNVLAEQGLGSLFLHRTGHGIGLESHEDPYIVVGNTTPLAPGMAFSIEPGIYWPGLYGARIEDIVICTDSGVERLNTLPTELVYL